MTLDRVTKNGSRHYRLPSGALVPSVTSILQAVAKPALIAWSAKVEREAAVEVVKRLAEMPRLASPDALALLFLDLLGKQKAHAREMGKAAEIGSQAHALIEWELRRRMNLLIGPRPVISDAALWAYMAWEDWAKQTRLEPVAIEETVWSDKWMYAGTADLIAWVDGELTLLDWKTGKAVYQEAHLQNAAYRWAWNERKGDDNPVTRGVIVRLPKVEGDAITEAVEVTREQYWFELFLHAKALWHGLFEGSRNG